MGSTVLNKDIIVHFSGVTYFSQNCCHRNSALGNTFLAQGVHCCHKEKGKFFSSWFKFRFWGKIYRQPTSQSDIALVTYGSSLWVLYSQQKQKDSPSCYLSGVLLMHRWLITTHTSGVMGRVGSSKPANCRASDRTLVCVPFDPGCTAALPPEQKWVVLFRT